MAATPIYYILNVFVFVFYEMALVNMVSARQVGRLISAWNDSSDKALFNEARVFPAIITGLSFALH